MVQTQVIYYFAPYDPLKRIGQSHNDHCALVPNLDDWICVTDSDVLFLLPDSKKQIADIIAEHGDEFQVYGCLTNRIASPHQRPGKFSDDTDIMNHKEIAMRLQREKYLDVAETVINIAGFLMIFKKKTWEKYRFSDNSIRFDSEFTNKVMAGGGRLGIMQGVYVFHDYRLGYKDPRRYIGHLV